ncbi:MAG: tripartite tricarboxylate transporter permease [Rhodobacteraceae bacterium]|nr:tripartite tricarboxylate transporter permease [Paracoccaceae bacterium]MCF8515767.1 tripartite tricarboxylate transporter permease [Paracoccaceae bacterium]MCF8520012.1 tripartite tricarboxylate transporter permease [Paracoccaceae bacterium]
MEQFQTIAGLFVYSLQYWWVMIPAVILGNVVGAIPGFSAANTIIILLPLTLSVDVEVALIFMMALYSASQLGNGIPAILVNIPGTGGAAATTLDGYPMAQKGQAQRALVYCFVASIFGGLIGTMFVLSLLPILSQVGYYLHSVEMVVIILFGLTLIAVIAAKDLVKGLLAGLLGLLIGAIGTDFIYSEPRATFGLLELYDGVPLVPALIGLFAVSEIFTLIERGRVVKDEFLDVAVSSKFSDVWAMVKESMSHWFLMTWTAIIGVVIGIIPGAGASIASFVAYQQARTFSKTPELFGTGIPEGVAAPESANNGVTSGTLVPLMAIGVPGGSTAAIMMVVLQYHGVTLGPRLFIDQPELAYGIFTASLITYLMMIPLMFPMAMYMSRVTTVPAFLLVPMILAFTMLGAFVPRGYMFDMGLAVGFGLLGYIARKTGYHVTAILIGVILGPLMEQYLMRALRISRGDVGILFSSYIGNALWVFLIITLLIPFLRERMTKSKMEAG